MATIISHSLVGFTLGKTHGRFSSGRFLFWMTALPALPDLDYIGFAMGIPYGSLWGHRGITHSLSFALIAALVAGAHAGLLKPPNVFRHWREVFALFVATSTHGFLDALTNGGLGVAFYSPLDEHRYFFPWRPISVSPLGADFFSDRGLQVLINEAKWIGLPCLALLALHQFRSRR